MTRRTMVFAFAVAVVLLGSLGWASADDPASPGRHEYRSHRLQQWLGLTDDQMAQIRAIRQRDAESWKHVGRALRQAQAELRRLALTGASPDTIQAKETEVQQLLGQMVQFRVKGLQEIAPLLSAEQREKLAQGRRGHGHRGPRDRGPLRPA